MAMKRVSGFLIGMAALCGSVVVSAGEVSPTAVDGAVSVDAAKAKALFDSGVVFIDVRSDKDWAAGRIPDAVHIELKKKFNEEAMAAEVKKGDQVVIYCNGESCMRSSKASAQAVSWGFTGVHYFRDGFPAWKAAGYPVE
jgi:rhodanese-related sulfurtransferase